MTILIGTGALLSITLLNGTWPMFGGDSAHSGLQNMKGYMSTTPVIKWQTNDDGVEWQFGSIVDVDNDYENEVVVADWRPRLRVYNGNTGAQEWSAGLNDAFPVNTTPAITHDLNGNGHIDIVESVGATAHNWQGAVFCFDAVNQVEEWRFYLTDGAEQSSATIADVDNDGVSEVIVGDDAGYLYCINGITGDTTGEWTTRLSSSSIMSSPAVANLDADPALEVVVGSDDNNIYCVDGATGTIQWSYNTGGDVMSSPVITDVDADGQPEVLTGSNSNKLICLNGFGSLKWEFSVNGDLTSSPAVANIDSDPQLEVFVGTMGNRVYCVDGSTGTQQWRTTISGPVYTPISVADIDGDNQYEILMGTMIYGGSSDPPDTLYALNAEDGSLLWKIDLGPDVHSPFVGDVDNDGCVEIVAGCIGSGNHQHVLFVLDDPDNHTGCGSLYNDVDENARPLDLEFKALGTGLYLHLSEQTHISLNLYDASGRLVQKLYNGSMPSGSHTFIPDLTARGVYFAVLKTQNQTKTVKIAY